LAADPASSAQPTPFLTTLRSSVAAGADASTP